MSTASRPSIITLAPRPAQCHCDYCRKLLVRFLEIDILGHYLDSLRKHIDEKVPGWAYQSLGMFPLLSHDEGIHLVRSLVLFRSSAPTTVHHPQGVRRNGTLLKWSSMFSKGAARSDSRMRLVRFRSLLLNKLASLGLVAAPEGLPWETRRREAGGTRRASSRSWRRPFLTPCRQV